MRAKKQTKRKTKKKALPCGARRHSKAKAKKKATKKAKKKVKRSRPVPAFASEYQRGDGRLLLPNRHRDSTNGPVAPSKIQNGIDIARGELRGIVESLNDVSDGLSVAGIELEVSFSADGKFLGIGVGGATSIKVAFAPSDDD